MKLSQTGMGTVKLNNIDEMYPGQSILLQTGQLVQYGAGIFGYNTIPLLVKNYKSDFTRLESKSYYKCKNNMEAYILSSPSVIGSEEDYFIGNINEKLDINYLFIINTNTKEVNYNEFYNYIDNINNQCFKKNDKYSNR